MFAFEDIFKLFKFNPNVLSTFNIPLNSSSPSLSESSKAANLIS
jgi:hypothetical protein